VKTLLGLWLLAVVAFIRPAAAYPFMIGHGYTGCAQCHVDPSGGSALTDYGRGQAEIFMRSVYTKRPADFEPGKLKDFAFGVPLPKELQLQADVRDMVIPEPSNFRNILMQADLRGHLKLGGFHAYGSIGYVSEGGDNAWFTSNTGTGGNVVSREYWLGYDAARGLLVRGGRMALPYGIRSEEHILFARSATRTTTNDDQQVGLDAVYGKGKIRAEVMGIAGNFQLGPDDYRERGYSALFAYAPKNTLEIGVSSLVTHANLDVDAQAERLRQAHGVFARYAPIEKVRFFAEANATLSSVDQAANTVGSVGYLQVDVEPAQGLHLKATGEWCDDDHADTKDATVRGSATALWFFAPHVDVRVDGLYGTLYCTPGAPASPMGLVQLHMFL
jgi:hypothetical protein